MFTPIEMSIATIDFKHDCSVNYNDVVKIHQSVENLLVLTKTINTHGIDDTIMHLMSSNELLKNLLNQSVEIATEGLLTTIRKAIEWLIQQILLGVKKVKEFISFLRKNASGKVQDRLNNIRYNFTTRLEEKLNTIRVITIDRKDYADRQAFYLALTNNLSFIKLDEGKSVDFSSVISSAITTSKVKTIKLDKNTSIGFKVDPVTSTKKDAFNRSDWNAVTIDEIKTIWNYSENFTSDTEKVIDTVDKLTVQIKDLIQTQTDQLILNDANQTLINTMTKLNILNSLLQFHTRDITAFNNMINALLDELEDKQ